MTTVDNDHEGDRPPTPPSKDSSPITLRPPSTYTMATAMSVYSRDSFWPHVRPPQLPPRSPLRPSPTSPSTPVATVYNIDRESDSEDGEPIIFAEPDPEPEQEEEGFSETSQELERERYKSIASFASIYGAYLDREKEDVPPVPPLPFPKDRSSKKKANTISSPPSTPTSKARVRAKRIWGNGSAGIRIPTPTGKGDRTPTPTMEDMYTYTPPPTPPSESVFDIDTPPATPPHPYAYSYDGEVGEDVTTPTPPTSLPSSSLTLPLPSTPSQPIATPTPKPKHHHALLELLSSERAYLSDLRVLKEVYIPLAGDLNIIPDVGSGFVASNGSSTSISSVSASAPSLWSPPQTPSQTPRTSASSSSSSQQQQQPTLSALLSQNAQPPMTPDDIRTIFGNVDVLHAISEVFVARLARALRRAGLVEEEEEGAEEGEESVGEVILDLVPKLEKPYMYYITRHPRAMERWAALNPPTSATAEKEKEKKDKDKDKDKEKDKEKEKERVIDATTSLNPYTSSSMSSTPFSPFLPPGAAPPLPPSPSRIPPPLHPSSPNSRPTESFKAYLALTASYATPLTNAWDVPSLLIKPIQRLLKYALLLSSIIESMPGEDVEERGRCKRARKDVEEVARRVNEMRRRLEVVRGVLEGKLGVWGVEEGGGVEEREKEKDKEKEKGLGAKARLIAKSKSLPPSSSSSSSPFNAQDDILSDLTTRHTALLSFISSFEQGILSTLQRTRSVNLALGAWSTAFGGVIGMGEGHGSEALEAFEGICKHSHSTQAEMGLGKEWTLLASSARKLLKTLEQIRLLTASGPSKIFRALSTLSPAHRTLLNLPYPSSTSKRPPAALVGASQTYAALAAQTKAEMPIFLGGMEDLMGRVVVEWGGVQGRYWGGVRGVWGELWSALGMDGGAGGEGPGGGSGETVRAWWERFEEVERFLATKHILKREKARPPPNPRRGSTSGGSSVLRRSRASTTTTTTTTSHTSSTYYTAEDRGWYSPAPAQTLERVTSTSPRSPSSTPNLREQQQRQRSSTSTGDAERVSNIISGLWDYDVYQRGLGVNGTGDEGQDARVEVDEFGSRSPGTPTTGGGSTSAAVERRRNRTRSHSLSQPQPPTHQSLSNPNSRPPPYSPTAQEGHGHRRARRSHSHTRQRSSTQSQSHPAQPLYTCATIHAFFPPTPPPSFRSTMPFLNLRIGDVVDILQEMGSPSMLEGFCEFIEDEGRDCLLIGRSGDVTGWVLASFLVPLE